MNGCDDFDYIKSGVGGIHNDGDAFRLLQLHKGTGPEIQCGLFKALIGKKETLPTAEQKRDPGFKVRMPYEALSYVWGNPAKTKPIILNGQRFMITRNLHQALMHLRSPYEDRIIWVDAVCVDQSDNDERNHQVMHMAVIYQEAERVIIWLGESTYEMDVLMEALRRVEKRSNEIASKPWAADDPRWKGIWAGVIDNKDNEWLDIDEWLNEFRSTLTSILARPWFRRAWVLQECAHAKSAIVACGHMCVAARIFALAPAILQVEPDAHSQAVLDIMPGFSRQGWWSKQRDLYTLLVKFRDTCTTEVHDRVYALRSMATDLNEKNFPRVDYRSTVEVLIAATSKFLFPSYWPALKNCYNFQDLDSFLENLPLMNRLALKLAAEHGDLSSVKTFTTRAGSEIHFVDEDGHSAFSAASIEGHDDVVRHLLAHGIPDPNFSVLDGHTPLISAIDLGLIDIIIRLLQHKDIDPNKIAKDGQTPLSKAIRSNSDGIVALLLQNSDIDVNTIDYDGKTPLGLAATNGNETLVKMISCAPRVQVNLPDLTGRTPLSLAIEHNRAPIVEILTRTANVDLLCPDPDAICTLDTLSISDNIEIALLLVDRIKAKFSEESRLRGTSSARLVSAIQAGNANLVMLLLVTDTFDDLLKCQSVSQTSKRHERTRGDDLKGTQRLDAGIVSVPLTQLLAHANSAYINIPDQTRRTLFSWAVENQWHDLVQMLVEVHHVDLNHQFGLDQPHIFWAIKNKDKKMIKILLEAREKIGDSPSNPKAPINYLVEAVLSGDPEIVESLLRVPGIDPNSGTSELSGTRPLYEAVVQRNKSMVKLLLQVPTVDPNLGLRTWAATCPLFEAISNGDRDIVELLLQHDRIQVNQWCNFYGHDFRPSGSHNNTKIQPLVRAVRKGDTEIVRLLLNADGIDANCVTSLGQTPLALAVYKHKPELVKLLLQARGIDVNIPSAVFETQSCGPRSKPTKYTPLYLAIRDSDEEITRLLLACDGIDVNSDTNHGLTPLALATAMGNQAIVKQLLQAPGINGNQPSIQPKVRHKGAKRRIASIEPPKGPVVERCTPWDIAVRNADEGMMRLLFRFKDTSVSSFAAAEQLPLRMAPQEYADNEDDADSWEMLDFSD